MAALDRAKFEAALNTARDYSDDRSLIFYCMRGSVETVPFLYAGLQADLEQSLAKMKAAGCDLVALCASGGGLAMASALYGSVEPMRTSLPPPSIQPPKRRAQNLVTAAALLFCVAIGTFATSGISFIQELGVGTAVAVAIDATIIRALLVPSLMALLGAWNWWAPGPLRRLHLRIMSS